MTPTPLTSPTAELKAYRDELRGKLAHFEMELRSMAIDVRDHWEDCLIEVVNEINRRESCQHEDFADTLSGQKCLACGFEMDTPDE